MADQGFVEKRHIACRHESMGVGSMKEAGIDAPQRSSLRKKIGNHPQVQVQIIQRRIGHQENFIEKIDEELLRTVDDALALNFKKGFIFPHAEVFPSGEDESGNFHLEVRKSLRLRFLLFSFQLSFQGVNFVLQGLVLGVE